MVGASMLVAWNQQRSTRLEVARRRADNQPCAFQATIATALQQLRFPMSGRRKRGRGGMPQTVPAVHSCQPRAASEVEDLMS
jgi:hypothetical protein